MDTLLSATPSTEITNTELSVAYDFMNSHVDFMNATKGKNVPSQYHGGHVQAGVAVTEHLWIDGSFWQRSMKVSSLDASLDTWQIASQYQILDGQNTNPSISIRASTWGNTTDEVKKDYGLLGGTTKTTVMQITEPHDQQAQLDFIVGLPITSRTTINIFTSIGASEINFGKASAGAIFKGCSYNLSFQSTGYIGTLAAPCSADIVITYISQPYGKNDINIYNEARYHAIFYQLGMMTQWQAEKWRLRAGILYLTTNRSEIDKIIQDRGWSDTYSNNQHLTLNASYRAWKNLSATLTADYFTHQFLGEIPFAYNSVTSDHFDKPYGLLSTGLSLTF